MNGKASNRHSPIPRAIWTLGFVSLLMDVSSEMVHALLPVFLVSELGALFAAVGLIEGIAKATAAITKIFSGVLSDWLGRRKALAAIGYGLSAIAKPTFPLAASIGWIVTARFVDRVGKGVRDALVADLAPPEARGASMGLRQALFPLSSRSHCSSSAFASRCGPRAARRASRSAFPNCGGTARSFGSPSRPPSPSPSPAWSSASSMR